MLLFSDVRKNSRRKYIREDVREAMLLPALASERTYTRTRSRIFGLVGDVSDMIEKNGKQR